ncbi:peptidoglycan editing factor PgeF [bacterium]|nr:peptidoglycan editing factor PgeF [bacterium]
MRSTRLNAQQKITGRVKYWTIPGFEQRGCRVAFFTRYGGVSTGKTRGLNLGLNTEDNPANVLKNRQNAFHAGSFGPYLPVVGNQVHGKKISLVDRHSAGKGWEAKRATIKKNDGLMTKTPGLPLAVSIADCLPILFMSEKKKAVAAVHAGWKGMVQGILISAVQKFKQHYGIRPEHLWVAIGPGIGPQHFEVSGEALAQLRQVCPKAVREKPDGRTYYDLWFAATAQLIQQGINEKRIITIRECTASHPGKYFSYRREKSTGRMLGIVQILQ